MNTPILSRRSFLKLAGAAAAAGVVSPAFTPPRAPYVKLHETVSYIGLARHPAPTFIGATTVRHIGQWDNVGYPCTLELQAPYNPPRMMEARFYDCDLSNLLRDVPDRFWDIDRRLRYPNVHAYVREQRYGEDPIEYARRFHIKLFEA
jgi:hypothetical protein